MQLLLVGVLRLLMHLLRLLSQLLLRQVAHHGRHRRLCQMLLLLLL